MKRLTTLLCLALLLPAAKLWAKPISPDVARNTVEQIFTSNRKDFSLKPGASNILITPAKEYKSKIEPFYAFNRGENDGFILLSGDDELPTIIGYSDSGSFSYTEMPEALRAYLNEYADYVTAVQAGEVIHSTPECYTPAQAIAPLLTVKWGQSEPYNLLCPISRGTKRMPTGCVATAMAQVMKYYNYPTQGKGSHSYNRVDGKITVDFSQSHYEWDKMLDTYVENEYTEEQANAVALLMRDLGVAVEMQYSSSASGAYTSAIAHAMINYFGYSDKAVELMRNCMSTTEWMELMYTELAAGRPLLYAASSMDGSGHQFVCDGMDSNGLLHINWGWDGMSDGYYDLSYMNPDAQGIGGSNGSSGYVKDASIIINLQPAPDVTNPIATLLMTHLEDIICTASGREITISAPSVCNRSGADFDGEIGVAIEIDGVQRILSQKKWSIEAWYYNMTRHTFTLPADIADGTYSLYFVSRRNEYETDRWDKVQTPTSFVGCAEITVTGEVITVSTEKKTAILSLSAPITTETDLYPGISTNFIIPVYNSGTTMFDSSITLKFYDIETNSLQYTTSQYNALIYDQSHYNMIIPIKFSTLKVGKYYVDAVLKDGSIIPYEGERSIIELKSTDEHPDVYLYNPLSVENEPLIQNSGNNTISIPVSAFRSGEYLFRIIATNATGDSLNISSLDQQTFTKDKSYLLASALHVDDLAAGEYILTAEWLNKEGIYEPLTPAKYNNISVTVSDDASINSTRQETFAARFIGNLLQISQVEIGSTIQVIDLAGRLLYTGKATETAPIIPLNIGKGIYLVSAIGRNTTHTLKVTHP